VAVSDLDSSVCPKTEAIFEAVKAKALSQIVAEGGCQGVYACIEHLLDKYREKILMKGGGGGLVEELVEEEIEMREIFKLYHDQGVFGRMYRGRGTYEY